MKLTPSKAAAILEEFMESEETCITSDARYMEAAFYLIRLGKRIAKNRGDMSFKGYKEKFSKERSTLRKEIEKGMWKPINYPGSYR